MKPWMQKKTVLHKFKFDFKLIVQWSDCSCSARVVVLMIVYFRNVLLQYSKNPRVRTRIFSSQPKQVLTEMVISTNLGYLGSFFLNKK